MNVNLLSNPSNILSSTFITENIHVTFVFFVFHLSKALRNRARKAKANKKPNARDILPGSVIENVIQTRRLAETALGEPLRHGKGIPLEDERPTNTGSGSNVSR